MKKKESLPIFFNETFHLSNKKKIGKLIFTNQNFSFFFFSLSFPIPTSWLKFYFCSSTIRFGNFIQKKNSLACVEFISVCIASFWKNKNWKIALNAKHNFHSTNSIVWYIEPLGCKFWFFFFSFNFYSYFAFFVFFFPLQKKLCFIWKK